MARISPARYHGFKNTQTRTQFLLNMMTSKYTYQNILPAKYNVNCKTQTGTISYLNILATVVHRPEDSPHSPCSDQNMLPAKYGVSL